MDFLLPGVGIIVVIADVYILKGQLPWDNVLCSNAERYIVYGNMH